MIESDWKPTAVLAYSAMNSVMQRWERTIIEYVDYGGRSLRTERTEYDWRQLPRIDSFGSSEVEKRP